MAIIMMLDNDNDNNNNNTRQDILQAPTTMTLVESSLSSAKASCHNSDNYDDVICNHHHHLQAITTTLASPPTRRKARATRGRRMTTTKSSSSSILFVLTVLAATLSGSPTTTTTTSSSPTMVAAQPQAQANAQDSSTWSAGKYRAKGEEALSLRQYDTALEYYNKAIELEPQNSNNYYYLYKVHLRMKKYEKAIDDLSDGLTNDETNIKLRTNKAKLLKSLGQCDRSVQEYDIVLKQQQGSQPDDDLLSNYQLAKQCEYDIGQATQAFLKGDYESASKLLQNALKYVEYGNYSHDLLWQKAQSLYEIGDYYGTISDTGQLLKVNSKDIDCYELRGKAYYKLNEHELAIKHFREGLKLDPEHKGCKSFHKLVKSIDKKYKKGQDAYDSKNYNEAIELWLSSTKIDPTHKAFIKPVTLKIATAHSRGGEHDQAISVCESYMKDNIDDHLGLWTLGEVLQNAERYEQAIHQYQKAAELLQENGGNDDDKKLANEKLQAAKIALKQSKEKNYYKILGISRSATSKEIKKAYRELALKYHPDKIKVGGDISKEEAETKFQDIGEAYEVLSDDELKAKYDRGEDVFDNQGGGGSGGGRHHFNAHQFFNQHMGQQGGGGGGRRMHFKFG